MQHTHFFMEKPPVNRQRGNRETDGEDGEGDLQIVLTEMFHEGRVQFGVGENHVRQRTSILAELQVGAVLLNSQLLHLAATQTGATQSPDWTVTRLDCLMEVVPDFGSTAGSIGLAGELRQLVEACRLQADSRHRVTSGSLALPVTRLHSLGVKLPALEANTIQCLDIESDSRCPSALRTPLRSDP
jgi:hypothetical protein